MSEQKRILIPVDFTEQSLVAIGQSFNLARLINAELTLLHVIEDKGAISKFFTADEQDSLKKKVQVKLDEIASDIEKNKGIKVETMIAKGSPHDKITEIASLLKATFIIMGKGEQNLKKKFLGSSALKTVRESEIPVITIRGKHHRDGCNNIVLPLDLTKETREKVNKAIELSKLFGNATVRVVSVLFTTDEFVVNRLTRQLGQVKTFLEKADVPSTAEIIKGIKGEETLAQVIIDYANKVDGDLVMIMTQQEVDHTPFFLGSSAQEIILNSDIPVMSIIPMPRKDTSVFKPY